MIGKIRWSRVILITFFSQIFSFITFFMFEVLLADILRSKLEEYYSNDVYFVPFLILLIGIIVNFIMNFIVYTIVIRANYMRELVVSISSMALSILTISLISYIVIEFTYADQFIKYTWIEKIILFPQYVTFFSLYILESPVDLWSINSFIFALWMIILMKLFIYENTKVKKISPANYSDI